MLPLRISAIGFILLLLMSPSEGQPLNEVCAFHPMNEELRQQDAVKWLEQGLRDCSGKDRHSLMIVIPAPDPFIDKWSSAEVVARLCDFSRAVAILPATSIHLPAPANRTHSVEPGYTVVCALPSDAPP